MPEDYRFEPELVLRALVDHGVDFVVIGGYGAALHGSPAVTLDTDICPSRTPENLDRLALALRSVNAKIRTESDPQGLPVTLDRVFLAQMKMVNLITDGGAFDLGFEPAAFPGGYDELVPHAVTYRIGDLSVPVASLADIIDSKRAAGRPKDHATLPILLALQDEIADRERADRDRGTAPLDRSPHLLDRCPQTPGTI